MALLRWELKKVWRPGLMLAIALYGAGILSKPNRLLFGVF